MRILITGASRGIGHSICKKFTSQGHYVYAPDRNELDLSKQIKLSCCDFDIIINNAGINILQSIVDSPINNNIMQVNYFSPLSIIQQCLPHMIQQNYGRIINIGSIWIEIAKAHRFQYSASKSALHSLTKSLAVEFSKYNILSNTVSPGFIDTDLTKQNNSPEEIKNIISDIPINRLGETDEIAELVYFLSVKNSFMSGQNIIIDGGYSCSA